MIIIVVGIRLQLSIKIIILSPYSLFLPFGVSDRDVCEGPAYSRSAVSRSHRGVRVLDAAG